MTMPPDIAIRLQRAAFNRALASADLDAIAPLLTPGAILVAGTDSGVISGRKAQLLAWKREFAATVRAVYTRTPDSIILSPVEPIAFEHGAWSSVTTGDDTPLASGNYTAKWREVGGRWVIEAELFLTLA
ncbi:nuclear transport factor 2 family protein [Sphingomonas solaris]|uniref:Nuclear transport factor 2 family protein n=1 Tax=Alterirhizorhabdus solaris TaxID=2529389 RepID=A0A558QY87_9SPHN|nr:nuclear transport factor 2 family protein [Sphingomonas solaris]TVV72126.1 nuclear transport factor 2 family protein [Sphingomonas solaris]